MSDELTYYFSTGSRYSYLSVSQLPDIEQRYGVKARWVPVNGKRMRALRGVDPFHGPPQSGQYDWSYRETDAAAWASMYGIAFVEPQSVEFDVECLLRGVIAASQQIDVRGFAWALAGEVFANDTWPLNQEVVEKIAHRFELDMPTFTAACELAETQKILEENCAEAVSRGAFGTPSLFVGDDLFWGNDRLVLVKHRLANQCSEGAEDRVDQDVAGIYVLGLDHVVLRTHEPEVLVSFYTELLQVPIERVVGEFLWQLRIGDSLLDVMRSQDETRSGAIAKEPGHNMDHFCLRVWPYDEAKILARLKAAGIEGTVSSGIYGAQGFGPSVYFNDPAGNRVELKRAKL